MAGNTLTNAIGFQAGSSVAVGPGEMPERNVVGRGHVGQLSRDPTSASITRAAALEVARVLPGVELVTAPTPELDQVMEAMEQSGGFSEGAQELTYLENDSITPELMDVNNCIRKF